MTSESKESDRLSEYKVKLSVGDWLDKLGFQIFDEKENIERPKWRKFEVRNISRSKKPDLIVRGNLKAANTLKKGIYIAIEIKRGYKHSDILNGFDAILNYYSDYLWATEYWIDDKQIPIYAFVFATFFSERGYLFSEEGKFNPKGIVKGPWDAYPMTFTISRLLWRQKDNLVKRFQALSKIPNAEKKLKITLYTGKDLPEIGVLVQNPKDKLDVLLMLSKNPYHWHFEAR
ncbi:MAG: hypothetical protein ACFFDI_13305 [Promethearchaeota archaeon]